MLYNIFLFKGKKFQDLKDLNIYSYPNEIISINDKILVNKIIKEHNKEKIEEEANSNHSMIDKPIAQSINELNIYSSCVDGNIIIGLIFNDDDNPYDYKEIFEELLSEFLNNGATVSFDDEIELESLLISIFIDIRRFGDEVIEKSTEIDYHYQKDSFYKAFLFGIDDVGKSSLVRRLKTGEFNDNFFTPTKSFNIEYIQPQPKKELLAFWDMPGQRSFREKWLTGLQDSNIIVFMIDIANQRSFAESKKEFWNVLNNRKLDRTPLLILGNKFDLFKFSQENLDTQLQNLKDELSKDFGFDTINNREWIFLFTSVKTNFNIDNVIPTILHLIST